MQKKFATVDGDTICYVDEGTGPALLLVHGFLVSHAVWEKLIPPLSKHFRVIAPDHLGHGDSARPSVDTCAYDAETLASRLSGLLDHLGVKKASVVGHSMGGKVSVHLATRHPEKVERLMLLDAQGMPVKLPLVGRLVLTPGVGRFIFMNLYKRPVVAGYFKGDVYEDPKWVTDALVDEVYRCLNLPNGRAAMYRILQQTIVGESRFPEMLKALKMPVKLLWGAKDKIFPVAVGEEMQRMIPGATLQVIPGIGHSPPDEAEQITLKALMEFGGVTA